MEWITTSTILQRLRDFDDRSMWSRFCARFRRPLVAFGRKYGLSAAEAEDAAQDALAAFAKAYGEGRFDPAKGRLSSWLFGIAYHQVASARRQRARHERKRDARGGRTTFWAKLPEKREASHTWDVEWERAAVAHCLRQVRREVADTTYRAFDLITQQHRTPDQAAAELGMSRDAVYVAKHRVLKRVRELLAAFDDLSRDG